MAASLITTSFQLGSALGLAVFSGIATSRTSHLLAAHTRPGGTHRRVPAGPARAGLGRRASGCSRGVVSGSRAIVVARTMGARCFRNK
jgi:hypothetical protein